MTNKLGFSVLDKGELRFPIIGAGEKRILTRFVELFDKKGDQGVLESLITAAKDKKIEFSEPSVRFWAPLVIKGRFGPLEPLLSDPELEEIMVNGIDKPIFVYHKKKGMQATNLAISEPDYFLEISNRMLGRLGRRVDSVHPKASGMMENLDRVTVITPPYGRDFFLDIRRFSAEPLTVLDLIDNHTLTAEAAAFVWMVFEAGNTNIGIIGNTGAGKTTLLNALIRFVPKYERIVVTEEVPEISPLQDQVVNLISVDSLGISLRDSVIDSLRLRPDRMIIGEVRSDTEVSALHESCLSGQALGTYFTYHAENTDMAKRRLISQGFPEYDVSSIGLWINIKRFEKKGKTIRRITSIFSDIELFRWAGQLRRVASLEMPSFDFAFDGWKNELRKRTKYLKTQTRKKDHEFFENIQKEMQDV
ncbi:MAG: CpaF family protein [Candidatus Altiarchaeota archaeon]|nr:CpaF family protein [Candidatus Altiarchaeota archaeon]